MVAAPQRRPLPAPLHRPLRLGVPKLHKLKKAQRELSHKQKGSKNREKARLKVARAHALVADARREFHHQLSTQLIRENQAIGVEDLAVRGLARTRLAKSVRDAGWARFVAMREYKAVRYQRTLVKIGRFEPTSQTRPPEWRSQPVERG